MSNQTGDLLNHLHHRGSVLRCVKDGLDNSQEIAKKVGKSRSSVDRDLRLLKEHGLIQEFSGEYTTTLYGDYGIGLLDISKRIEDSRDFFPYLPKDLPFMANTEMVIRDTGWPHPEEPIDHIKTITSDSDSVKVINPFIVPGFVNFLIDVIGSNRIEVEMVVVGDFINKQWIEQEGKFGPLVRLEGCKLWQSAEHFSHFLIITDRNSICLGVTDNSNRFLGTVASGSEVAIDWAMGKFNNIRSKGDRIFLRGGVVNEGSFPTSRC